MENLSAAKVRWFRRQLGYWGRENLRDFQWRRTRDAYAIFVAEFLLQKMDGVARTYDRKCCQLLRSKDAQLRMPKF